MRKNAKALVFGAVAILAMALMAVPATTRADTRVTAKFSIASGWAGAGAASDGINFLVGLESDTSAANVAAQLVSIGGTIIGSPVALGHAGQACCTAGLAFDGTNYLVAWEEDQGIKNDPAPFLVYGQFMNQSGAKVGAAFAMTTAGIWFDGVNMLAFGGGQYLLTYTRLIVPANGDASNNRYVAGRIVSPDGTLGSEFRISTGYGNGSSVAFDGTNFFVVWKEDSLDYEVRGRFVSISGTPGLEISINASPALSDNPVVAAFDGTNYMVIWTDRNVLATEADVFGQRVSTSGALVGGAITIASDPGFQMATGIAFNGNKYLVTWIDMSNDANGNGVCDAGEGTCWDVYGQYVGTDGVLAGSKVVINTDVGNQFGGVGCLGGRCIALVSSGIVFGQGGPSQVGDVYGAFVRESGSRADFNNDGKSDIVWRNVGSGYNYLYPMSGLTILAGQGYLRSVPEPWMIAGVGDFDGDGKADLLWRNAVSGDSYIFLMNGTAVIGETWGRNVPISWTVAGIGDLNGDGKADIVWRNATTGDNYVYFMNGLTISSEGYLPNVPSPWTIATIGDFDGDGKADLFWRNTSTGDTYFYLMNGLTIANQGYGRNVPTSWAVIGAADYNGDSKADLLWRNAASGDNYLFLMNGMGLTSEGYLRSVPAPWTIVGAGDYDGDGKADILWRNSSTGDDYVFLMNGLGISSEGYLPNVPTSWAVVQ